MVLAVIVAARHLRHGAPVQFVPISAATSTLVESDTPSPLG